MYHITCPACRKHFEIDSIENITSVSCICGNAITEQSEVDKLLASATEVIIVPDSELFPNGLEVDESGVIESIYGSYANN